MKSFLISATAAVSLLAIAPAIAQPAPNAQAPMAMPPEHQWMQPMTRAEAVQKVQQHFAMLDSNRDGFLTTTEIEAGHGARHSMEKEHSHAGMGGDSPAMFDRIDSNHDGMISRGEFNSAHQAMAQGTAGAGKMRMGMHAMREGMAEHMFANADANKDGRVSLQEATAAAAAHFDRADANHDGTMTPDEMRAAHQAMRGRAGR